MHPGLLNSLAIPGLDGHGVALLAVTALVFAVFIRDRLPIPTVWLVARRPSAALLAVWARSAA